MNPLRSDARPSPPREERLRGVGLIAGLGALALLLASGVGGYSAGGGASRLVADLEIAVPDFPELSGLAWCAERGTLIAVSDHAGVAEITLEGEVLRELFLGEDFEGVVVEDAHRAWLLEERSPALLEFDLDTFEVIRRHSLPRFGSADRDDKNLGLEGLGWDAARQRFLLLNEGRPAALATFSLEAGLGRDIRVLDTDHANECVAGSRDRVIILSRSRGLRLLEPGASGVAHPWHDLGVRRAEGLAFVPGFGLLIAIDRKDSRILVMRDLDSFDALAHVLQQD